MTASTVACLLPARNASADLDGWFESVERFADVVVALDDGSTDDTAAVLAAHPLVRTLLRNPPRAGYAGWDDAANRQRLIDALEPIAPRWIVQLDADERVDESDALALRRFLERSSVHEHVERPDPTCAYLLGVCRMIGDQQHWDRLENWAGRVFAYRPGIRLPTAKLHLTPLPCDISPERYVRMTLRIQHLANLTPERREARHRKYAEADPSTQYQPSYAHLLDNPSSIRAWTTRADQLPVVLHGATAVAGRWPIGAEATVERIDLRQLRAAVNSSTSDLVVLSDGVATPSELLLERMRTLPSSHAEFAMFRLDPPGPPATLARMLADERGADSPGAGPHAHPGRCQVFRRAVLVEILDQQTGRDPANRRADHSVTPEAAADLDALTDLIWERGYGAACVGPIDALAPFDRSPRPTLRASLQRGKVRGRRAVAAERERAPHRGVPTHLFGVRGTIHELRAIVVDQLRRPTMRSAISLAIRMPVVASHVALQHASARRLLVGVASADRLHR